MRCSADIDKDTVDFRPNYDESDREPSRAAGPVPEPPGQRGRRHRGRHGDQHPAAQPRRGDRCLPRSDRRAGARLRAPARADPGAGLSDRRRSSSAEWASAKRSRPDAAASWCAASTHVEEVRKDRDAIIVTEIPYQVNKARMLERIGELVRERRVEGIAEVRDESDRDGTRVVIELKREADPDIVLNQLFRHTAFADQLRRQPGGAVGGRPAAAQRQGCAERVPRVPRGGDRAGAARTTSRARASGRTSCSASRLRSPTSMPSSR